MTTQILLETHDLAKEFKGFVAVSKVNLRVRRGTIHALIGPNGAGKTTLFNLISGDLRLDAGELLFSGAVLQHEPPYRRCQRGIGRTYQIPKPYGAMTTFENLLVAAMFGASRSERDAYDHCAAILDDCGLGDKANVRAGSLTLLNRKRLEMARALATNPKLLLLDEIAGGLTEHESGELVKLVKRVRERNVTVIWIEHVLHAVMAAADRMMVLNFGEKIAEGAPQDVIADPNVRRVYMGIEA